MQSSQFQKQANKNSPGSSVANASDEKLEASKKLGAEAGMPVFLQRSYQIQNSANNTIQRQEEEEEALQTKRDNVIRRQAEEEEEELLQPARLGSIQRQPIEEEEMLQPTHLRSLQRQPIEEEEEELQTKPDSSRLQRQPQEEEEEMLQPASLDALQRQPIEEEEEELQAKSVPHAIQRKAKPGVEMPIQKKLTVGEPNDEYEQEADAVADKVMRMASTDAINIDTMPALRRNAESTSASTPGVSSGTESKIQQMRGNGAPLPQQVSNDMGSKMGADFSGVNVHTGSDASDLNRQVNARAFTLGNDVFFGDGEYTPNSDSGQRLLAHELTHVAQQNGNVSRTIMRDGPEDVDNATGPEYKVNQGYIEFPTLPYPSVAKVDSGHYANYLPLIRHKNYSGNRQTSQSQKYLSHIGGRLTGSKTKLAEAPGYSEAMSEGSYIFKVPSAYQMLEGATGGNNVRYAMGSLDDVALALARPTWMRNGHNAPLEGRRVSFEVDHIVEAQVGANVPRGSYAMKPSVDEVGNYILLRGAKNQSKGDTVKNNILATINGFTADNSGQYGGKAFSEWEANALKNRLSMKFLNVDPSGGLGSGGSIDDNDVWTVAEIEAGDHINALLSTPKQIRCVSQSSIEQEVDEGDILVFHTEQGGLRRLLSQQSSMDGTIQSSANEMLKPFRLHSDSFIHNVESAIAGTSLATLYFSIPENSAAKLPALEKSDPVEVKSLNGSLKLGYFENGRFAALMGLRQEVKGLSPIEIFGIDLTEQGLSVTGQINPSVSFIEDASVNFEILGDSLTVSKSFTIEEIKVPPPFGIDQATVTLSGGTAGFELEGDVGFSIDRIGHGTASTSYHTTDGVAVDGNFNFDERIFGEGTQAQVRMGYRKVGEDYQWSMGGTLTIPEGKVPGVRSATINVDYSEAAGFSAQGDAQLDVPGVESGTLAITHSEEEGFVIGGSFNLSGDTPGIRGGSISAQVRERPDGSGYTVSARGEAQPDIPGINSNLIVSYDDGAFTAEVTADYSRGMLSGEISAGVTNRTVGEDGQLTDTAQPENPLIVYGGGSLTIQIAPWLQGTAGVQFAPNGEITVTGEIGLPNELEIFARREINRSIFNIAVQAPIFPGIVAEIGGGLGATAGIGPGVIDELRLGITYNPAHEEDTTITGDAHLNVPADAGLRLSVRAGIGLGITGASATGGLEIGGTLGIEGAAEAGVHVEWSPARGLDLSANVSVHAQPAFTFDISGYVSVRALGFSVYDQTWELASFRFGSDYRFGITLPIHYQEGQPFDISTDDIEFEVPDIDTDQLMRGLISRIA
jgi:hypothetical protein